MKHIGDLVSYTKARALKEESAKRKTERGEMMRYFVAHINAARIRDNFPAISMARMGKILQGIPTKDLYYLKSVCDKAKNFSKKFWWEVDPKKHVKENPF